MYTDLKYRYRNVFYPSFEALDIAYDMKSKENTTIIRNNLRDFLDYFQTQISFDKRCTQTIFLRVLI